MADPYVHLTYPEWKELEQACRAFKETEHGEGTPYYHKSFRLKVGNFTWEFHAPLVKARMAEGEASTAAVGDRLDELQVTAVLLARDELVGQLHDQLADERERTAEQRTTIEQLTQRIAELRDDIDRAKEAEEG